MHRNEKIEAGFAVLQRAGIGSHTARELLEANPACADILLIMSKSSLFGTDHIANKTLFANLIHASSFLLAPPEKQPWAKKISIDTLTNCYHMLDSQNDSPSFLTPEIQHKIMCNVHNGHLAKINKLLEKLQPLNKEIAVKFFANTDSYTRMAKIIGRFDDTNESFIYFFQHAHPSHLDILVESLMMDYPKWLTKSSFKLLVDHIKDCSKIIHGFNILYKSGLLDTYGDAIVERPDLVGKMDVLAKENMLTNKNISQIFTPSAGINLFKPAQRNTSQELVVPPNSPSANL